MAYLTYLRADQSNLKDAGVTIAASSASTVYPLVNLTILPISDPFRFTGCTSENLQIDLSSAKTISLITLLNHNLTSAATITVNGGSSANPDGSQFTTTITYRQYDAWKQITSNNSWRYWKLIFADSANPAGYIQIGQLLMGNATVSAFNFAYGWQITDAQQNVEVESEFGVAHVSPLFSRVQLDLAFRYIAEADAATLRTLWQAIQRSVTPLFVIPDSSRTDAYFMRCRSDLSRTIDFQYLQSASLTFLEESRGKSIN